MIRFITIVLISISVALTMNNTTLAQDPCSEIGSDCRLMTATEVKAFKERLLAVKALLPVPDSDRYVHDGAAEASTMPFIAETGIPNAAVTCRSWPGGCFAEYPYNTLFFAYLKREKGAKTTEKPKDPIATTMAVMTELENRIEVGIWLLPHPYFMDDFNDADAVNVQKSATFLSWESGEDNIELNMIFGPRTGNEEETLLVGKPARNFAPVKSIELKITGPKAEVSALKKKINRQAIEALLGAVVK